MTDVGNQGQGLTPLGFPGAPFFVTFGPWTGTNAGESITNNQVGTFAITGMDANENAPTASDTLVVQFFASPVYRNIWGTTVGTGHDADFYDLYRGLVLLQHGQNLNVISFASSASSWYLTLFGYYIRQPRSPTLAVFP